MSNYFDLVALEIFRPFSPSHWSVLILIAVLNSLVFIFRTKIRANLPTATISIIMAALLLLFEICGQAWAVLNGIWSIQYSLPLHLCGISTFLCALMLFTKSYALYEVAYFWGLAGATQALLTPDISFGFPHFIFFQFFVSHALIVTSCLWITFIEGFRPYFRSVWKAFGVTNIYMVLIAILNYLIGSNYLYICHKPENPSLMDNLGPWPWYIISAEFVCLFFYLLCYSPFVLSGFRSKKMLGKGVAM